MFIHFCCLCPLGLAFKLNFNISKGLYFDRHERGTKDYYISATKFILRKLTQISFNQGSYRSIQIHVRLTTSFSRQIGIPSTLAVPAKQVAVSGGK